ncbi:MAG TPA: hypothetical protein VMV83_03295 [Rectinemataceae bacterium]|nr:hypothetical protein [Rectinemataceae bacterium]
MKKWGILLLAGLVGAFVLTGCQPAVDLSGYAKLTDVPNCATCHVGPTSKVAINTAGYEKSGHFLGTREYDYTAAEYGNSGSHADGEYKADCAKCHTGPGFTRWQAVGPSAFNWTSSYESYIDYGKLVNMTLNSSTAPVTGLDLKITCYTCHTQGHTLAGGEASVALPSGMSADLITATGVGTATKTQVTAYSSSVNFDGGAGSLCANCHQNRDTPEDRNYKIGTVVNSTSAGTGTVLNGIVGTPTTNTYVTYSGPHHGPQSDFLLGASSAGKVTGFANGYAIDYTTTGTTNPTFATSPHYTYVTDTCAACHVNDNASSGHANYLTSATGVDEVAVCQTCHTSTADKAATKFININTASFDLNTIETAKITLLTFFGNPAYFPASATATTIGGAASGPVQALNATGTKVAGQYTPTATTAVWLKDWDFGTKIMTSNEAQAFWNFSLFTEDRSLGVHNPVYAAQLLYDAIQLINVDAEVGGVTGWVDLASPWASRPQ